jgi:hypothetical protein
MLMKSIQMNTVFQSETYIYAGEMKGNENFSTSFNFCNLYTYLSKWKPI